MPVASARLLLAALALALLATVGCSDDEETYALLRSDEWTLQEAVDPPADDPVAAADRPPVTWYAEYVQSSGNSSRLVRLSGHQANLASSRAELERVRFGFDDVEVDGWRAVGGVAPDGSPAILLLDNGDTTIMALSHELGVEDLADLAATIHAVDQPTWVAAGGVVL